MECQRRLCLIQELNLLRSSGKGCMNPWIPNCASVLLITLKPMVRPRESIKFLRICWELVLCNTEEVGIRVWHMPSSPTIIVTKRVWRWHRISSMRYLDEHLWVAHTLSLIHSRGMVGYHTTQWPSKLLVLLYPINLVCVNTKSNLLTGAKQSVLNRLRWGLPPSELWT
jgi:hypothetical protein